MFNIAEQAFIAIKNWNPISVLLLTPIAFCASYAVVRSIAPNAKGSGIPQVMASIDLNSKNQSAAIDKLLNPKILLTKIFSSLLMIQGGAPIGREGPTIQISASIFRTIDKMVPLAWPKLSSQNFIITGAAAGLAAAFNTPLGGVVFAIEELAKIHVRFFRTALFTAVILAGLTAQGILGPYLYLGYPEVNPGGIVQFLAIAFVSLTAGLGSTVMCSSILWIRKAKSKFAFKQNLLFALASSFAVAVIGVYVSDDIFGSGKDLMNRFLFTDAKASDVNTPLLRVLGPILCFNAGGAGGIFAPSLAAGASFGSWISHLLNYSGTDANLFILCGMVAFLTGVTRTPFTSAILVLEMTDRHGVIFYLMFAAIVSYLASMVLEKHSLYELLKADYLPVIKKGNDKSSPR